MDLAGASIERRPSVEREGRDENTEGSWIYKMCQCPQDTEGCPHLAYVFPKRKHISPTWPWVSNDLIKWLRSEWSGSHCLFRF